MMKRILAAGLALLALAAPLAQAQAPSFSQDMKDFGVFLGEKMAEFGQQVQLFSQDPGAYLQDSHLLERVEDMARQAGQSIEEYWPTFKASVKGSVQSILDSEMTLEEKVEALKEYGEMALPFLADVDFEAMGEEARLALGAIKGLMGFDTDEQTMKWIEANKQKLEEFKRYLTS